MKLLILLISAAFAAPESPIYNHRYARVSYQGVRSLPYPAMRQLRAEKLTEVDEGMSTATQMNETTDVPVTEIGDDDGSKEIVTEVSTDYPVTESVEVEDAVTEFSTESVVNSGDDNRKEMTTEKVNTDEVVVNTPQEEEEEEVVVGGDGGYFIIQPDGAIQRVFFLSGRYGAQMGYSNQVTYQQVGSIGGGTFYTLGSNSYQNPQIYLV